MTREILEKTTATILEKAKAKLIELCDAVMENEGNINEQEKLVGRIFRIASVCGAEFDISELLSQTITLKKVKETIMSLIPHFGFKVNHYIESNEYNLFELTKGKRAIYISFDEDNVIFIDSGGVSTDVGSLDELKAEITRYFIGAYDSFLKSI